MGTGSVHGKNSDPSQTVQRGSVLSGYPKTGPAPVGHAAGLKARISHPPRNVLRGERLKLNGHSSTGFIKSYRWSFAYNDGGDVPDLQEGPGEMFDITHSEINIVILRDLKVTLTVTDSENRVSTDHVNITAKPRTWRTSFKSNPNPVSLQAPFEAADRWFGRNTCSCSVDIEPAGHTLHRKDAPKPKRKSDDDYLGSDPDSPTFYSYKDDDSGFSVAQVDDPGGPFNHFWYVSGYNVYVDRVLLVNRKFFPGGDIEAINNDTELHRKTVSTLLRAVKAHEQIHSDLIRENLPRYDPAMKLEKFIAASEDALSIIVNMACTDADDNMQKSSPELEVHRRLRGLGFATGGELLDGSGDPPYVINSFADLGDSEKDSG